MENAYQMDFNFEQLSELQGFLEKVKKSDISDDEIYRFIDNSTGHFDESKTKELIHELKPYLRKADVQVQQMSTTPVSKRPELEIEKKEQAQLNQNQFEKESQRKEMYPQIFADGGWLLFKTIVENYTKDDKAPVAKFSNLYHFFKYEHLFTCTQLEYIDFVNREYDVCMSKILPTTSKYHDNIFPLLSRMMKYFAD